MGSDKPKFSLVACAAEFVAMALFVVFGCGSAMGIAGSTQDGSGEGGTTSVLPGWVLMVALAFGLAITTLVYAIGHISGGHINCAVTFGLVLAGECSVLQGIGNFVAQMLGSMFGALILCGMFPMKRDQTQALATNGMHEDWNWYNAFIGEVVGTFLLMFVVLQTAVSRKTAPNRALAPVAIGLAVFIAHTVLIPIDGCSINPTRSFGPAVVAQIRFNLFWTPDMAAPAHVPPSALANATGTATVTAAPAPSAPPSPFKDMWIFWVGPLLGSALAVCVYSVLRALSPKDSEGQEMNELTSDEEVSE